MKTLFLRSMLPAVLAVVFALPAWSADKNEKKGKESPVYPAAVLPFQERGRDSKDQGAKVTDLLFAQLATDPALMLVDREDIKKLLDEQELSLSGLANPAEANKVGQLTGAKLLITGSVLQVDSSVYLIAKIIGTETSRVVGASVKGNVRDDLGKLVEDLGKEVSKTVIDRADDLVAKPVSREDRVAALKKKLGDGKRPSVLIEISEQHMGQVFVDRPDVVVIVGAPRAAIDSPHRGTDEDAKDYQERMRRRHTIDPAAETEITLFCTEAGFKAVDPKEGRKSDADILIRGEAFSERAVRHGNLISVKARIEVKAIEQATGKIVAIDRQTTVAVDLTEQIAAKNALQEAGALVAERLLPKIVTPAKDKTPKGK